MPIIAFIIILVIYQSFHTTISEKVQHCMNIVRDYTLLSIFVVNLL